MFLTAQFWILLVVFIKCCHGNVSYDDYKKFYNKQVVSLLDTYELGNYSFQPGTTFKIYKPDQSADFDINASGDSVSVNSLEDRKDCLGLTTEISETIMLDCPADQPNEPGCFYVFSPSDGGNEGAGPSDETQVEKVCVEVLNERCVGITTPNNWTLPLHCIDTAAVGNS